MKWHVVVAAVLVALAVAAHVVGIALLLRVVMAHGSLLQLSKALGWTAFAEMLRQSAARKIKTLTVTEGETA